MNLAIIKILRYSLLILVFFTTLVSCQCSGQKRNQKKPQHLPQTDQIQVQRDFLKKERASIEAYIKDRSLEVEKTGTGLYYHLNKDSISPVSIESEDRVVFHYDIFLMNGRLIYSSEENGAKSLIIDNEDAEIGLHECLKLMTVGDEGLFILPSHLAFGVAGDQIKVPPKTALVYEIKILEINKSKKQ